MQLKTLQLSLTPPAEVQRWTLNILIYEATLWDQRAPVSSSHHYQSTTFFYTFFFIFSLNSISPFLNDTCLIPHTSNLICFMPRKVSRLSLPWHIKPLPTPHPPFPSAINRLVVSVSSPRVPIRSDLFIHSFSRPADSNSGSRGTAGA